MRTVCCSCLTALSVAEQLPRAARQTQPSLVTQKKGQCKLVVVVVVGCGVLLWCVVRCCASLWCCRGCFRRGYSTRSPYQLHLPFRGCGLQGEGREDREGERRVQRSKGELRRPFNPTKGSPPFKYPVPSKQRWREAHLFWRHLHSIHLTVRSRTTSVAQTASNSQFKVTVRTPTPCQKLRLAFCQPRAPQLRTAFNHGPCERC